MFSDVFASSFSIHERIFTVFFNSVLPSLSVAHVSQPLPCSIVNGIEVVGYAAVMFVSFVVPSLLAQLFCCFICCQVVFVPISDNVSSLPSVAVKHGMYHSLPLIHVDPLPFSHALS